MSAARSRTESKTEACLIVALCSLKEARGRVVRNLESRVRVKTLSCRHRRALPTEGSSLKTLKLSGR